MGATEVRVTISFNVHDLTWHVCDSSKLVMIWKVYIGFAEISTGGVKRMARVNVHDSLTPHACMSFGLLLMGKYFYYV